MKNLNKFSRYLFYISCLSGAIWLGSYITRLFVAYRLFQPNDFIIKDYIDPQSLGNILYTLLPAYLVTFIFYIIFFVFFILFLATSKLSLKNNGWLFIITVTVLLTFPFEAYLMTIDFNIISLLIGNSFNSGEVLNLIVKRFKVLSSFPAIEIFCYFAVIFLLVFQPLTKNIVTEEH